MAYTYVYDIHYARINFDPMTTASNCSATDPSRERKQGLTVDRVVTAAVALADAEGIERSR